MAGKYLYKKLAVILRLFVFRKYSRPGDLAGSLLLEILVVIGLFAIIAPLAAQVIVSGLYINKWSAETSLASGLADETLLAAESIAFQRWLDVYGKIKGDDNFYHPYMSAGAWTIVDGAETLAMNGREYQRYFTVNDACRDNVTGNISGPAPCLPGNSEDPSTQLISATVVWDSGRILKEAYLTRWRNQICRQSAWGSVSSGPVSCPSHFYESSVNIDFNSSPGSLMLRAQ